MITSYQKYAEMRDRLGYSDYMVSIKTGITKSIFSEWKADRSKPKVDKLHLIAQLFKVPIEYFLEEDGGDHE